MKPNEGYVRGAFIVFTDSADPLQARRVIPFRFNPEGLSRSLQIEQAAAGQGVEGAQKAPGSSATEQAADATSGALKETFSVQVRLDYADREAGRGPGQPGTTAETATLGILPEIAALEELMYPTERAASGAEPTAARAKRPTVLLAWGPERVFPVKVLTMTINETMHNRDLCPVRAEVEVGLEVAREGDARGNLAVQQALDFSQRQRRRMAARFYEQASKQSTRIPDFEKGGSS
jgi:contractile injection system tube protein